MSELLDKVEAYKAEAERRRQEFFNALASGEVSDPITASIFTIAVLKGVLISAALTIGSSPLTRSLQRSEDVS